MAERMECTLITCSEEETHSVAAALAGAAQGGEFIALTGRMGAGKTAFARGFAAALGGEAHSPTFTIVQEYDTVPPVYHFDLYRLASVDELYAIGYDEYTNSGAVILMEWPREEALPASYLRVELRVLGEDEREIRLEAVGDGAGYLKRSGLCMRSGLCACVNACEEEKL